MARDIDDDAPWLAEGVPDNRRDNRSSTMVPRGRLFGGVAVFVLLLALIAVGLYVVVAGKKSNGSSSAGVTRAEDAPLIAADPGPYKVAPASPGGLAIEGADQTIYAAGTGVETGSTIDASKAAEEPLDRPVAGAAGGATVANGNDQTAAPPKDLLPQSMVHADPVKLPEPVPGLAVATLPKVKAAPKVAPKPETRLAGILDNKVAPAPIVAKERPIASAVADKPAAAKAGVGPVSLQLGAFSSADKAEAAWTRVTAKHGELGGFDHRVEPLDRAGTTLYRLRVRRVGDHDAAAALCAKLASTGDACLVAS